MTDDVTTRLAELEDRLQRLEDERDIARLIASYGPLVDAGEADDVASLWDDDGTFDVDEVFLQGRGAIAAMVRSAPHQSWIHDGCAHFLSAPRVEVVRDDAIAVCHSLMVVNTGGSFPAEVSFTVRRATAHHWTLRRTPAGWRVTRRTSRVLDGRADARDLLASGATGEAVPESIAVRKSL
jgi:uncharacterized protein (TIGR02246 family)